MSLLDVPSPIDLREMSDARQWADEAMVKRPWRTEFFAAFAEVLDAGNARRVLELGSGPGFLAQYLLQALLAGERIGGDANRVRFVERSFRVPDWVEGLGPFDHVVTHQAVHELRHKRHTRALHEQVRGLLAPGGRYLVCDHVAGDGGMKNDQLYMSIEEQRVALAEAGFARVEPLLLKRGLMLYAASVER